MTTVKLQSTIRGKRVIQDRVVSGGGRVVFKCDRSDGDGDPRFKCDYKCIVRQSKAKKALQTGKPWHVSSFTGHSVNCLSEAQITYREAMACTSNNGTNQAPSSIEDTQYKICGENHIPKKACSKSVANRVRLKHCYVANANYEINWAKLDAWGKEFEALNPGSHVHVDVDGASKFYRMFVGVEPCARIALKTGIDFSGIDGTFFEHVFFNKGSCCVPQYGAHKGSLRTQTVLTQNS